MLGIDFLFKGLILGISVAAPVGPIGLLCINRTLNKRFASGFVTGLGAATADAFYGLIAGFGLTAISSFLLGHKTWIQLGGAVILVYFGIQTLSKKTNTGVAKVVEKKGLIGDYLSSLFLTVSNPMTILFFIAVFTGLGILNTHNYIDSLVFVIGVFIGSGVWWFFLSVFTSQVKHKLNENGLKWINIFSGLIILGFAAYLMIGLFRS